LKVCADLEGARSEGDIHQVDTYFKVAKGRFKLRVCEPGETYLVHYHRENRPEARASDYRIEPVHAHIRGILSQALGILAEVVKVRTLYLWENVRIHLDRVEGLGDFIEFEAVLVESDSEEEGFRKVKRLRNLFQLDEEDLIEGSYLEMTRSKSERGTG